MYNALGEMGITSPDRVYIESDWSHASHERYTKRSGNGSGGMVTTLSEYWYWSTTSAFNRYQLGLGKKCNIWLVYL